MISSGIPVKVLPVSGCGQDLPNGEFVRRRFCQSKIIIWDKHSYEYTNITFFMFFLTISFCLRNNFIRNYGKKEKST